MELLSLMLNFIMVVTSIHFNFQKHFKVFNFVCDFTYWK